MYFVVDLVILNLCHTPVITVITALILFSPWVFPLGNTWFWRRLLCSEYFARWCMWTRDVSFIVFVIERHPSTECQTAYFRREAKKKRNIEKYKRHVSSTALLHCRNKIWLCILKQYLFRIVLKTSFLSVLCWTSMANCWSGVLRLLRTDFNNASSPPPALPLPHPASNSTFIWMSATQLVHFVTLSRLTYTDRHLGQPRRHRRCCQLHTAVIGECRSITCI